MSIATTTSTPRGPARTRGGAAYRYMARRLWVAAKAEGGLTALRVRVLLGESGDERVENALRLALSGGHLLEVRRHEIGKPTRTIYRHMGSRP